MKNILLILILLCSFSCRKEQYNLHVSRPQGCDSLLFTFEENIIPIFSLNCNFTECHATSGEGSYDFTKYSVVADRIRAGTMEYRLDLPFEDPQHMPEKMKLNDCDYYTIKTWINQGYPEK